MWLFLKIRNRLLILVHSKFLLSQNCAAEFKIEYLQKELLIYCTIKKKFNVGTIVLRKKCEVCLTAT